jgi:predicted nucleic-acid-binding protein
MIGLDTNVLARYITQDDSKQAASAGRLIESLDEQSPGYITLVTLVELAADAKACAKQTLGPICSPSHKSSGLR